MDVETEEVRGMDTDVILKGTGNWSGLAVAGGRVFAAPGDAEAGSSTAYHSTLSCIESDTATEKSLPPAGGYPRLQAFRQWYLSGRSAETLSIENGFTTPNIPREQEEELTQSNNAASAGSLAEVHDLRGAYDEQCNRGAKAEKVLAREQKQSGGKEQAPCEAAPGGGRALLQALLRFGLDRNGSSAGVRAADNRRGGGGDDGRLKRLQGVPRRDDLSDDDGNACLVPLPPRPDGGSSVTVAPRELKSKAK